MCWKEEGGGSIAQVTFQLFLQLTNSFVVSFSLFVLLARCPIPMFLSLLHTYLPHLPLQLFPFCQIHIIGIFCLFVYYENVPPVCWINALFLIRLIFSDFESVEDLVFQVAGERYIFVPSGGRFSKWGEVGERDGFSPQIGGKVGPSAPTHVYIEQIFSLRRATNTTIWLCQCSASSHLSPIVVRIRPEN